MYVRAKKSLGQHFLKDESIAKNIVDSIIPLTTEVLEIGPGMGVLTKYLLQNTSYTTSVIEIDRESIPYLKKEFPQLAKRIIHGDFLEYDLTKFKKLTVIGNLPYNISSQIFFKVLENRDRVPQVVCMIQKEVAERIASKEGSKVYGILSVFLQAFYTIEYLFTVHEHVFAPPPKVKSGVIRLLRNERAALDCDEKLFFRVVKTAFNQRRKTMNNSLKPVLNGKKLEDAIMLKRPEQLTVEQFVYLTNKVDALIKEA